MRSPPLGSEPCLNLWPFKPRLLKRKWTHQHNNCSQNEVIDSEEVFQPSTAQDFPRPSLASIQQPLQPICNILVAVFGLKFHVRLERRRYSLQAFPADGHNQHLFRAKVKWNDPKHRWEFLNFIVNAENNREKAPQPASLDKFYALASRSRVASLQRSSITGRNTIPTFHGSFGAMVAADIVEHHWKHWRFNNAPDDWWSEVNVAFLAGDVVSTEAVRGYMEDLADELGVGAPLDWMSLPRDRLTRVQQKRLGDLGGIPLVLNRLHPYLSIDSTEWMQEKIHSKSWWVKLQHTFSHKDRAAQALVKALMESLGAKLGLPSLDAWESVRPTDLDQAILSRIDQLGGIRHVLRQVYPEHKWRVEESPSHPQGQLTHQLHLLLPNPHPSPP